MIAVMRLAALSAMIALSAKAHAQRPPPPSPYASVIVEPAPPEADASFIAFRNRMEKVAASRHYADLERLVVASGFFWDRDFERRFDPARRPAENLAAALKLEHNGGAGWQALSRFAAEPSLMPADARPGVLCGPARATFDQVDFGRLIDGTRTSRGDWAYPIADKTAVHAAASKTAPVLESIGRHFVRMLGPAASPSDSEALRREWTRIVLPDGRLGFVAPGALTLSEPDRLCYARDPTGLWHIAGFAGGSD